MVGLEALGVVDEAIEDGIGEGGIADDIVPGFDGALAGVETIGTEVVEDQRVDLGQREVEPTHDVYVKPAV